MKNVLFIILSFIISINCFAYEKQQGFNYDIGFVVQSQSLKGYRTAEQLSSNEYGMSFNGSYVLELSNSFYLEPVFRFNLLSENTIKGKNILNSDVIDMLNISNPYNFMLRIGKLKIDNYTFELVLGLESTTYKVSQSFADYIGFNKSSDFTTSNFSYGIRILNDKKTSNLLTFMYNIRLDLSYNCNKTGAHLLVIVLMVAIGV